MSTDDGPRTSRSRTSWRDLMAYVFFAFLIVLGLQGWWQPALQRWLRRDPAALRDPLAASRPIMPRGNLAEDEKATVELFRRSSNSVVGIVSKTVAFDRFGLSQSELTQGSGTGFFWDNEGHVVTNYHVIAGGQQFSVIAADQQVFSAQPIGYSAENDLALLQVDAPRGQFAELPLGSSDDLEVGQKVFAIGNPFGLDQTLTTGIISGLGRQLPTQGLAGAVIEGVIQTDAAINPGNSGGPLLDSSGRLIGVNTAIVSPTRAYAGVGFAIPVDAVNRIVPQLLRHGRVIHPALGIILRHDNQRIVDALYARGLLPEAAGILVQNVLPRSTADEAGVRPIRLTEQGIVIGDLIVEINDQPMKTVRDLYRFLDQSQVGDPVTIAVLRELGSGKPQRVELQGVLKGSSQ